MVTKHFFYYLILLCRCTESHNILISHFRYNLGTIVRFALYQYVRRWYVQRSTKYVHRVSLYISENLNIRLHVQTS